MTVPEPIMLPNGVALPADVERRMMWQGEDKVRAWLERFPDVLQVWLDRYDVTLTPELPNLSFNIVLFGTSPLVGDVVVKATAPHPEITAEICGMRASQRPGIVELIDADETVAISIQKRVRPGTPLREHLLDGRISEAACTRLAARLMKHYWTPVHDPAGLIGLREWHQDLFAYQRGDAQNVGLIPQRLVDLAADHASYLLDHPRGDVNVHGDFHHDNILSSGDDDWTVIDPKGLHGEAGFEIGTWMNNPIGLDELPDIEERTWIRLGIFEEDLGIDRFRLWQWAMEFSVLTHVWNIDGSLADPVEPPNLVVAEILASMPEARRAPDS